MKWVEEKVGGTTKMKLVPDDYDEGKKEVPQRDLTTGGASLISMGMSDEDFKRIFKTQTNRENIATQTEKEKKR